MLSDAPKLIKKLYANNSLFLKFKYFNRRSFSQEGEDLILNELLNSKRNGFYVDVGAHHPIRFSNTHFFYKRGWSGINIDANPGSMVLFEKIRKRDVNLELAISNKKQSLIYYLFNEPALNTFSKTLSKRRDANNEYQIIGKKKISTITLAKVLDRYHPTNTVIDFLNIDVEGLDLEVLKSNDWRKYQPNIVLVEINEIDIDDIKSSPIYSFLNSKNYKLIAKTCRTGIFRKV
jgi:FkbM family methyltransferase